MHPADLETIVDRELRRLPALRAPATLLPRVLAAVQAWSQRPWYARAWFTWPLTGQAASIAALLLLAVGFLALLPTAGAVVGAAVAPLAARVDQDLAGVTQTADSWVRAGSVIWRTLIAPYAAYAWLPVLFMCAACAACALALDRVVGVPGESQG